MIRYFLLALACISFAGPLLAQTKIQFPSGPDPSFPAPHRDLPAEVVINTPRYPASNYSTSFDEKLRHGADRPPASIMVLLPDHTYLEFFPADVLTLRHLVDKLPEGTLKPGSYLYFLRQHFGVAFSYQELKTKDLTLYPLSRWDVIKIEDPASAKP